MKERRKGKLIKNNNKGSSYFMVLLTATFIGLIAAAVLSVALMNAYRMSMDKGGKDEFYACEKTLSEVRAGIQIQSAKFLQEAYAETMKNMVYYDATTGCYVNESVAAANEKMMQKYFQKMRDYYENPDVTYTLFNSYISTKEASDAAYIEPIVSHSLTEAEKNMGIKRNRSTLNVICYDESGNVVAPGTSNKVVGMVIEDVYVSNKVKEKGSKKGYDQYIHTSIELLTPDVQMDFAIEDSKADFEDYALIAEDGITFNRASSVRVSGNVYGGSKLDSNSVTGYDPKADAKYKDHASLPEYKYSGIFFNQCNGQLNSDMVVSKGAVAVNEGANLIIRNATDSTKVYVRDIVTTPTQVIDKSTIEGSGEFYVGDDLELNGNKSEVSLTGKYYGYNSAKWDDAATTEIFGKHSNSSAIIVNGSRSKLTLNGLEELVVAGRAYIDFESKDESDAVTLDGYATGESLSIKSNQLAYLIPDKVVNTVTKKVDLSKYNNPILEAELKTFLKDGEEVYPTTITVGKFPSTVKKTYYYYRFKNKEKAAQYVMWYTDKLKSSDPSLDTFRELSEDITQSTKFKVNKITLPNSASITTSGTVVAKKSAVKNGCEFYSADDVALSLYSTFLTNVGVQYKNAQACLHENPSYKDAAGNPVLANSSDNPFDYFIDKSAIADDLYIDKTTTVGGAQEGIIIAGKNKTVTIDATEFKGLIITCGDVVFTNKVRKVNGLVYAAGAITTEERGAYDIEFVSNPTLVRNYLEYSDNHLDKYFRSFVFDNIKGYAGGGTGSPVVHNVSDVNFADVVVFKDWKRNAD